MRIMNARWCLVGALGFAAVASVVAVTRSRDRSSVDSIAAEPPSVAPEGRETAAPEERAAVAAPLPRLPSTKPTLPTVMFAPSLPADYIEPWTGEDLAPVIAALPKSRVDRVDPWNPSIVHEVQPLDQHMVEEDPWDGVARRAPTAKKAQLALEQASPWDETRKNGTTQL